jgi:ABC-type transporter Mla MlaB component
MSDAKDNDSFLRKVVRFVANPTTDWADLNSRTDEVRETEYAKSELKAMIERKRRNDFVRKREFDVLRKVRREGLTSEQLAALGGSSRLDDSEGRLQEISGAKADSDVKAKINEIEQQMVGDNFASSSRRPAPSSFYDGPTSPGQLTTAAGAYNPGAAPAAAPSVQAPLPAAAPAGLSVTPSGRVPFHETPPRADAAPPRREPIAVPKNAGLPSLPALQLNENNDFSRPFAIEVSEVAHDPELDEAVIAFANADFEPCEQMLVTLTGPGGSRAQHAETWLVLFDLYRAIGERLKFESLALDYAQQFGWSAPQWFSLPQLVAEAASDERPQRSRIDTQVGWVCPAAVDADVVARLRTQTLQMPLPWVLDWSAIASIDVEACARLAELFRHWANEPLEMRWLSGERLLDVLSDAAPTGARDADPAYWLARLEALRLANRADQFDEAAIDYCVTYEVSPPSWERAKCQARISGATVSTVSPSLSLVSDASSSFIESTLNEEPGRVQQSSVELSGQLVGDIGATLAKMDGQLGKADIVNVSCSRLIRVDFIAAGDLLNWVLQRRAENRIVSFTESHRLVALFFGAMGINEHAKVKVRTV